MSEALRLLKTHDAHAQLRADIQVGLDQLVRGEGHIYDEVSLRRLAEDVKAQGRARLASKR